MAVQLIPTDAKPEGNNWMRLCDKDLDALFQKQATQVDFDRAAEDVPGNHQDDL